LISTDFSLLTKITPPLIVYPTISSSAYKIFLCVFLCERV
jgi:hypothetical protein